MSERETRRDSRAAILCHGFLIRKPESGWKNHRSENRPRCGSSPGLNQNVNSGRKFESEHTFIETVWLRKRIYK